MRIIYAGKRSLTYNYLYNIIAIPGSIDSNDWDNTELKERLHYQLAEVLQLNPVRIAGVRIFRDYQNIFVKAWLLSTVNAGRKKNHCRF